MTEEREEKDPQGDSVDAQLDQGRLQTEGVGAGGRIERGLDGTGEIAENGHQGGNRQEYSQGLADRTLQDMLIDHKKDQQHRKKNIVDIQRELDRDEGGHGKKERVQYCQDGDGFLLAGLQLMAHRQEAQNLGREYHDKGEQGCNHGRIPPSAMLSRRILEKV